MQRILIGALIIAAALLAIWLVLFSPSEPPPEPEPLPALLDVPRAYWAEAEGTISLDEMSVPGKVRLNYLVHPDNSVVVTNFVVWANDIDWVVPFLWWEAQREKLRCTSFRNDGAVHASLDGNSLVIPAGTKVLGWSYPERKPDGRCGEKARPLNTVSPDEMLAVHDPDADYFEISAAFEASFDEHEVTVSLDAKGHYLNRPPIAQLLAKGEGVVAAEDGCPVTDKGKPPIALANTDEGLLVSFQSGSYDPDGAWPETVNPKRPRVDINKEQWARSRPQGFSFLGAAQEIGPILFETGQEHQLLLWVTDRRGAEARSLCHFQVVASR